VKKYEYDIKDIILAADFILSEIEKLKATSLPSNPKKQVAIICFRAPMGAGKTTLIAALCKQLGVVDTPASPTFSIVNEYATHDNKKIIHMDLYRIKDEEELLQLGIEEVIENSDYCFIEWPQLAKDLLPTNHSVVEINSIDATTRALVIN
jgi:tRNA threonylcarbamoyladenosine biosynthesis protein TsaE